MWFVGHKTNKGGRRISNLFIENLQSFPLAPLSLFPWPVAHSASCEHQISKCSMWFCEGTIKDKEFINDVIARQTTVSLKQNVKIFSVAFFKRDAEAIP